MRPQVVLDLGCGPSVLGIAATLLGAGSVVRPCCVSPLPHLPLSSPI